MLAGIYSSAQCVPVASRAEQAKKFLWLTTCVSTGVVEDKHYHYVFRPQASGEYLLALATAGGARNLQEVTPTEFALGKRGGTHRLPSVPLACNSAARLMPARIRR